MTDVQIVNSALIKLGAPEIVNNVSEHPTAQERLPFAKRVVLRMHSWNCAVRREILAPLTSTPAFGYTYLFQLPSGLIRILSVNDGDLDWRIEGRTLLADGDSIELKYIADVDSNDLDDLCAECVALYLAYDLCYKVTNSNERKDGLLREFMLMLGKARFVDATEEPTLGIQTNDWLDSRRSSPGSNLDPLT